MTPSSSTRLHARNRVWFWLGAIAILPLVGAGCALTTSDDQASFFRSGSLSGNDNRPTQTDVIVTTDPAPVTNHLGGMEHSSNHSNPMAPNGQSGYSVSHHENGLSSRRTRELPPQDAMRYASNVERLRPSGDFPATTIPTHSLEQFQNPPPEQNNVNPNGGVASGQYSAQPQFANQTIPNTNVLANPWPNATVGQGLGAVQDQDTSNNFQLPLTPNQVPLEQLPGEESVDLRIQGERINLHVRTAPLNAVLNLLAKELDLSMVIADDVTDSISISLHQAPLENALNALVSIAGCTWTVQGGIIHVTKLADQTHMGPTLQELELRVFRLNFASAADIHEMVTGLLSPLGQCYTMETDVTDERKTREQLIVEDFPVNVARIAQFIAQLDIPPQQVIIQAHVLQVTLGDDTRHGVNFDYLQGMGDLQQTTIGFANAAAIPATFFSIDGGNVDTLMELITNTTDAKTLASPKVQVVSGQQARIQIGERLGFLVTTTTETSTLQDVQFLEVGVVLEVTPTVTNDGRVVMRVMPKISGGEVLDGLPQEETTEVDTTVMLDDGHGIVIGGLIQEFDNDRQSKLPIIGDLWLIGRLFQRRNAQRERRETIVALVPYIVPNTWGSAIDQEFEWERASTRLIHPSLDRVYRPWEPRLPDAIQDPRRIRYDRLPSALPNLRNSHPNTMQYYMPRASRNDSYGNPQVVMPPTYHDPAMSYDYGTVPIVEETRRPMGQ